jgi:hypothetical protein
MVCFRKKMKLWQRDLVLNADRTFPPWMVNIVKTAIFPKGQRSYSTFIPLCTLLKR